MSHSIGLIGLGNVGHCYAVNLEKAGKQLIVYDIDAGRRESLRSERIEVATTSQAVAQKSERIILSLPNPTAVKAVLLEKDQLLDKAGDNSLIIDTSTIDPETSRLMYREAKKRGISYLEAPISGGQPNGAGVDGARAGTVTFITAGDEEAYRRAQDIFDILGSKSIHLGEIGRGNTLKLISNLLAGLYMAIAAEAFILGRAAGFSYREMFEVFGETDAKSFTMFNEFMPHLLSDDYEWGFPVDLQHKDHRLAGELGQKLGVPLFFNQLALEVYQMARSQGFGRKSHAIVIKALANAAGITLPPLAKNSSS